MGADGAALLERTLILYSKHSEAAMRQLSVSLREHDCEKIKADAHALRSMSLNIGAHPLAAHCASLEKAAQQGKPKNEIEEKFNRVCQLFKKTNAEITGILTDIKSSAA